MNLKIKFELEETELNGEIENLIPSSSGGSLPSGGTTGQVLTKNSNADGDAGWKDTEHDLFNANGKTYEEVIYAYESGKVCYLTYAGTKLLNNGYSGNRNPFKFSGENSNGEILTATLSYDNTLTFGDRGDYQITTASQTLSKEKQSQALANIGGLSKNQGTANSGKFLGIGADGIVVPTEVGGGSSKNYRKIAEVTISEEINNIVISKDINGNPFEITEYFVYGTDVKATGATQICTSFNTTSTNSWGWTGINGFIDATTAKNIYMESIWIGRRILRLNSSQWNHGTLSVMHKLNNDQYGNVEKISGINLIAITYPFSQGTISVWGG